MKYYQQIDSDDCGPACFAMIASRFKIFLSISEIREKMGTNINGTCLLGFVKISEMFGLKAYPIKIKNNIKIDFDRIPLPIIALLNSNSDGHYVVVNKVKGNFLDIWDPSPNVGRKKIKINDFLTKWSGFAIYIEKEQDQIITGLISKRQNPFKLILILVENYKNNIFFIFLSSLFMVLLGISVSLYYRYLFDTILPRNNIFRLNSFSLGFMCIILFQAIIGGLRDWLINVFSTKLDLQIHFTVIKHLISLPLSFYENRKSGDILTRISDAKKINELLAKKFIEIVVNFFLLFLSTPLLYISSKSLFFILLLTTTFNLIISFIANLKYRKYFLQDWNNESEMQSFLVETMNNANLIKSSALESNIFEKYQKKKSNLIFTKWDISKLSIKQGIISTIIAQIGSLLIYWVGILQVIQGNCSIGTIIGFNSLSIFFSTPFTDIINSFPLINECSLATKRLTDLLDIEKEKKLYDGINFPDKITNISFQNVNFSYSLDKQVLDNLSLKIPEEKITSIVGYSGSGKSTIAKLILGLYNSRNGKIKIGTTDISQINKSELRKKIGFISQDVQVFSGTILENLTINNQDIDFHEIETICSEVGLLDTINSLPEKFNTKIGEKGYGLSGGERQRVAIARTLIQKPKILILDEATSNLDVITEKKVYESIMNLKKNGVTVIIIAHRLTSIIGSDQILVIDKGKLAQYGTHNQLISIKGIYQDMWKKVTNGNC